MAKPLFRLHHEEALRASQRLSWVFWIGVCASAAIYLALGVGFMEFWRLFLTGEIPYPFSIHRYSWFAGGAAALFCVMVAVEEYFSALSDLRHQEASRLALRMGAKPLESMAHIERFTIAHHVVQEIALASGMSPPAVFYLPNDDSINAFVLGGKEETVALVLSNGALNYLNRDELQALIAHEFGHIKNEDVFIYAKLSAILKGYYAIREWGNEEVVVSVARENILLRFLLFRSDERETMIGTIFSILRHTFAAAGWVLAAIGERIQSAFSREREWMADARAVQYTRNPQALVMVFKKALALQMLSKTPFAMPSNQAHHLFINYFQQKRTHPPLEERVARYGGKIEKKEIEALAYEIRTKRLSSPLDNPIELNQYAFNHNTIFPILTVMAAQQTALPTALAALSAREQLLAFFLYHSGIDSLMLMQNQHIAEQDKAALSQALIAVKRLAPIQHFSQFQKILKTYQAQSISAEQAELWQQIKAILYDDGRLNFYEICYAAQLQYHLQAPMQTKHYRDCEMAVHQVLRLVASLSCATDAIWQNETAESVSEEAQALCYQQLLKQSLPLTPEPFVVFDMASQEQLIALYQHLRVLSELRHSYRQSLGQTLEFYWQRHGQLNLQMVHLRQLLSALLA